MGLPLEIFFHVEEEVALVRIGQVLKSSCRKIPEDVALQSIERLESVKGVRFVRQDFDPFATTWPDS